MDETLQKMAADGADILLKLQKRHPRVTPMIFMTEMLAQVVKPELERLNAWVADLQSGMYVNCVYCGHRYGPDGETPVTMADALKRHVAQCAHHPMAQAVKALESANDALKSYAYGNASPELATEIAAHCDQVLKQVRG